jgi:hypothetical protein
MNFDKVCDTQEMEDTHTQRNVNTISNILHVLFSIKSLNGPKTTKGQT